MGYALFSSLQINDRPLAEILQNVAARQILPVSSLQVAGHYCRGVVVLWCRTVPARARRRLKSSRGHCYAVTESFFVDCSNERIFPLRGTSWAASIEDRKHAEKFAAVISLGE